MGNWNNNSRNWYGNRNGGPDNWNNNNGGGRNQQPAKRSGATYSIIRQGNYKDLTIVNAWNKSRSRGMITAVVSPYKKSKEFKSKKGNVYLSMIAKVTYRNTGVEKLIPCLMNRETQVIVLDEIGMVITPNGVGKTSSGKKVTGYFGTMFRN